MKFPLVLRSTFDKHLKEKIELLQVSQQQELKIIELEKALEKARRNDTPHDPVTGRFTKARGL